MKDKAAQQHVCPWWLGYFLTCPVRRFLTDPARILAPYVREGMTVLEPGPGMGFFTLELARKVGATGRVVAVDIQPKMTEGLKRRAAKARLLERIDARLAQPQSMGLDGLAGAVDFMLAFAVVHELSDRGAFFGEAARAMKPSAYLLLAEPTGHVSVEQFDAELREAAQAGLDVVERPSIRRSRAAVLKKV
jgi:ubiquinone/menaquinone biosynthesis C-methylase UbiE